MSLLVSQRIIRLGTSVIGKIVEAAIAKDVRSRQLGELNFGAFRWYIPPAQNPIINDAIGILKKSDSALFEKLQALPIKCVWSEGRSYTFGHAGLFGFGSNWHSWAAEGVMVFSLYAFTLHQECKFRGLASYGRRFRALEAEIRRSVYLWLTQHGFNSALVNSFGSK
jgi:hypothetical protein